MNNKLQKYEQLLLLGLFWSFLMTILRSFRLPNDWAEAHWLISYKFGFIKRALPGTIISPFTNFEYFRTNGNLIIAGISISLFIIFSLTLFLIAFRIIRQSNYKNEVVILVAIFLTSPFIVMSAHLNGYYDNIIILISVLSTILILKESVIKAAILLSIGVLVHETIFFIGIPAVTFTAFLKYQKQNDQLKLFDLLISFTKFHMSLILLPIGTIIILIVTQSFLDISTVRENLISHISLFNFIYENREVTVPTAFTTSFSEYLKSESPMFFERMTVGTNLLQIGLPLLALFSYLWLSLAKFKDKILIFSLFSVVTLLPLLLHIIAWDTSRIWAYPLITAFLAFWGIREAFFEELVDQIKSRYILSAYFVVFIFQLFSYVPLMDNVSDRFSIVVRFLLHSPAILCFGFYLYFIFRIKQRNISE